jgi:hypothetical protein
MAFSIDPGSFPQLGNPICEPLGAHTPACHNASDLSSYDPTKGGAPSQVVVEPFGRCSVHFNRDFHT